GSRVERRGARLDRARREQSSNEQQRRDLPEVCHGVRPPCQQPSTPWLPGFCSDGDGLIGAHRGSGVTGHLLTCCHGLSLRIVACPRRTQGVLSPRWVEHRGRRRPRACPPWVGGAATG